MKCQNCFQEMDADYKLKPNDAPLASIILQKKKRAYKITAYVCPQCGKVEFYIDCEKGKEGEVHE